MPMRPTAALLLFLFVSSHVTASDFRIYGVFAKDPLGITSGMVTACNESNPELAAIGSAALDAWHQRNERDASRVMQWFSDELKKQVSSGADRSKELSQLEDEKVRYLSDWAKRIESQGTAVCSEFIRQLERSESDLARMFPK